VRGCPNNRERQPQNYNFKNLNPEFKFESSNSRVSISQRGPVLLPKGNFVHMIAKYAEDARIFTFGNPKWINFGVPEKNV